MMAVTFVTVVSTAVTCPEPEPEQPELVVTETKSAERKSFEKSIEEGLYLKGVAELLYDADNCQKAVSGQRRTYRIQSDNQMRFCHVQFSDIVPSSEGSECVCTVNYRIEDGEETTLIVKLTVISVADDRIWLWNETQKVGLVIQKF